MTDPRDREVLGWADPQPPHQQPRQIFHDPSATARQPVDGDRHEHPAPPAPDLDAPEQPSDPTAETRVHRTANGWRTETRAGLERLSLRTRLLGILVITLLAALAVTGYGVQLILRSYLIDQIDSELQANYLHASQDGGFATSLLSPYGPPTSFSTYVSVDGHPDLNPPPTTGRPGAIPPDYPSMTSSQAQAIQGHVFVLHSSDGTTWRAVAFPAQMRYNHQGYSVAVILALPAQGAMDAVNEIRLGTLVVGLIVIAIGALLGWLAIRRSMRPLVEVEETAAAIAAGDLSRRIPERPASTEVGRLTRSLNGMLSQIESAFRAREASEARTRRFAADASHELRTPLVSIRGFAELFRQGAVPQEDVPRTMRRIEDEAKRMGSLVEDLLLLARLDEQRPGRHEPVDLVVLAGDAVHDARGLDAERTVSLTGVGGRGPEPAVVTGDEDRLRQVVANLVANAVRHTPAGTPIEVAVGRQAGSDGDTAVLEVRDHGRGLTPEQAERVFERFFRIDSSRRRDTGGGSGLGLSIVSAVVSAHAGQVEVLPTPGGGATFRVTLPARPVDARGTAPAVPGHTGPAVSSAHSRSR